MKNEINPKTNPSIVLWGISVSPFVRKIMVALAEKDISYTQKEVLPKSILQILGQPVPEDFDRGSPLGKVPFLQIDDLYVADSAVIAGYLDKKFPEKNKLYPADAESYARALWFEHYSDYVLTAVGYKKIFFECVVKPYVLKIASDHEVVEHAKSEELPLLLHYLDTEVTRFNWLAGNDFSMADIAIVTQLLALRKAGVELEKQWINLSHYLDKVTSRPSFQNIIIK